MTPGTGWMRIARSGLVFLIALVVFDRSCFVALDGAYQSVERHPELRRKLEGVMNKSAYQWLILGTSRTFEAVHPSFIARDLGIRAFKEASKGKGLRYNYEFYRLYAQIVGKPRLEIYGLDNFMFGNRSEAQLMRRFGTVGVAAPNLLSPWPPLLMIANKAANQQAVARILEQLQSRLVSAMGDVDPDNNVDDMEAYTGNPVSKVVERPAPAAFPTVPYSRYPGAEGEYFDKLLRAWQDDGVGVVLVYPPDYIATQQTNFEHDAFITEVKRLTAGCAMCVVVDYSDPARFPLATAAYFWDGDYGNPNSHLSKKGVEAFNRILLPDLKRIAAGFDDLRSRVADRSGPTSPGDRHR